VRFAAACGLGVTLIGIFAPSLSIGGAFGNDVARVSVEVQPKTLIASLNSPYQGGLMA